MIEEQKLTPIEAINEFYRLKQLYESTHNELIIPILKQKKTFLGTKMLVVVNCILVDVCQLELELRARRPSYLLIKGRLGPAFAPQTCREPKPTSAALWLFLADCHFCSACSAYTDQLQADHLAERFY
jgi:hypothetical protein